MCCCNRWCRPHQKDTNSENYFRLLFIVCNCFDDGKESQITDPCACNVIRDHCAHFFSLGCRFFFFRSFVWFISRCVHRIKPSNHIVTEPTHVCLVAVRPIYIHTWIHTVRSAPKKCVFQK